MPASRGVTADPNDPNFKMQPNRTLEDQEMEMTPSEMSTPPFSSPDPTTDAHQMLPLDVDPGAPSLEEASDLKATDWKGRIEAAQDMDSLDEIEAAYDESGADYSTVTAALDKRREELSNENGE